MINFIFYVFFSVLDTASLFYLALKLFKIDLYLKEIIFASLIMTFLSYVIRVEHGYAYLDVFMQFVFFVCFLWMLFRIHIFYATIMAGTALQAFMLIQSLIYIVINITGIYQLDFPIVSTGIFLMQLITDSVVIFIGYYIGKKRKGFDYIPDKPDARLIINKRDIILFSLSVPSVACLFLMMYFLKYLYQFAFLVPLFYGTVLIGYLYFSNKKDRGDIF
ncbi:hypothetical protein [Paenibacillus durus]|uniref:Uncharacterized protein n=1 Tax=Paenibacillus durus TaxID=44251 RepID=A0A089HR97_PAEDU|nr:hypothetical protein [Paenibacillus durus]AIQ13612.1 hypothetical protein PDUR_18045 [Paenibacillus durus]